MNAVKIIREAKAIAAQEGVTVQEVLYVYEIEARQMASALISQMYAEIQEINQLLQEMKQLDEQPPRLRRL